jgi:3-hydroxybutyryl-CoA dehydrogenase
LFRRLEQLARTDAILTTNSSSLPVGSVTRGVKRRDRTAGLHFVTPPHVVPVVEVTRAKDTSARTLARICAWMRALGKIPVTLTRDVPGMLMNRVQHAMMREAFNLIDRGIATPADIDLARYERMLRAALKLMNGGRKRRKRGRAG